MKCHACNAEISDKSEICWQCGVCAPRVPTQTAAVAFRNMLKVLPGIGIVRRLLDKEDTLIVRARVARRYIRGSGIEFGALSAPLAVPRGVTVRHADIQCASELPGLFAGAKITVPDIVTDIESMNGIEDHSVDFVIANHVIEHVENPLLALRSISRVLRPGGIAFIALPDKRFSFDNRRAITPLNHVIEDYEKGPAWSLAAHYDDWVRNVEGFDGTDHAQRIASLTAAQYKIHFHAWDFRAMGQMFNYAATVPEIGLKVRHSQPNRGEAIWILEK